MDNGKIRLEPYNKAILLEAYSSDELTLADIDWVYETIKTTFTPPLLLIVVKKGDYSISKDGQVRLYTAYKDVAKVAFVANTKSAIRYAESAKQTYLQNMNVTICTSIAEAYEKLTEGTI